MDKKEKIEALKLFNEKAEKLENLPFAERIRENNIKWSMKFEKGKELQIERQGPNKESIEAFVLTLRFFIQDNEDCSLRNMAKIYEDLEISQDKKENFRELRAFVNNLLDKESYIGFESEKLTNEHVFYTVIYGELAHANKEKKKEFDYWMNTPFAKGIINQFVYISGLFLKAVSEISDLNEKVLNELEE